MLLCNLSPCYVCMLLLLVDEQTILLTKTQLWVGRESARFIQKQAFKMHVYAESMFSLFKVAITRL